MAGLKRKDNEDFWDYYLRIDEELMITFTSVYSVSFTGESIEVYFNKTRGSFWSDWQKFNTTDLGKDLIPIRENGAWCR